MSSAVYTVQAQRSGGWWAISSRDERLRGMFSQARRFREVEGMAREAIALLLDVDESEVSVVVEPVLGDVLDGAIRERREAIAAMEAAQRLAAARSTELIRQLAELELSQRDVADVLGISFQRASQLWPGAHGPERKGAPARARQIKGTTAASGAAFKARTPQGARKVVDSGDGPIVGASPRRKAAAAKQAARVKG